MEVSLPPAVSLQFPLHLFPAYSHARVVGHEVVVLIVAMMRVHSSFLLTLSSCLVFAKDTFELGNELLFMVAVMMFLHND